MKKKWRKEKEKREKRVLWQGETPSRTAGTGRFKVHTVNPPPPPPPPPPRTPTPPRPLAPSLAGPSSGLKGQFMSGKEVSGSPSLLKVTSIQQHLTHTAGPASQPASHYGGGWEELEHWKLGMDRLQGKNWGALFSF